MVTWVTWIKALHIIAVIAWMAGLLYLPRLFVYHAASTSGSEQSETFKIMERRLLKAIMNPSMAAVWISGPLVAFGSHLWRSPWLHAKLVLVLALSIFHAYIARLTKNFAAERNIHSPAFYRALNEVPTVLMIFIVILVVVQPF